ncbi:MAG: transporter ATP-binding protein [Pseudomonadota bacterium]|jgi:branched-chain amino acid transport system ATP-binding protein
MSEAILQIDKLFVRYGGIEAVRGVSLSVAHGEAVALIGANGAGKTSVLRAITGLVKPHAGRVHYMGQDITHQPGHERPRNGLVMVPEGRGIFARMTVQENLLMGAATKSRSHQDLQSDLDCEFQRFPRLRERAHQLAGSLSGGEQQMLAMGRALMAKPICLLLDEPSMGLSPIMVDKIFETIEDVRAQGTSLLLVEQNAQRALQITQRGYVLESGELSLQDDSPALLRSPAVRAAYLGE